MGTRAAHRDRGGIWIKWKYFPSDEVQRERDEEYRREREEEKRDVRYPTCDKLDELAAHEWKCPSSTEVTLAAVSEFLRTLATTERYAPIREAMRGAVTRGTAKSVAPLVPQGWALGGKTGTGPNARGKPYDGWFAGSIFEGDKPRYTVAVYIERGGPGGEIAAGVPADTTAWLAGHL